jgi:peptide/nickel transport system substrate-binding protein
MFLNTERRPFDDVRVRRAVYLATDRARAAALAGGALVAMPACQILPHAFPAHVPYCPAGRDAPDVDRARALVAESGRAGERVVVVVPPFRRPVGRSFTALLDELGLRASLEVIDEARYFEIFDDPRSDRQAGFQGWSADYLSPSTFLEPHFTCAGGAGRSGLNASHACDPGLAALVDDALAARGADATRRWAAADRYVVDRALAVPLTNHRGAVLVSQRVGNVQHHLQWFTLLDQLWLK